MNAREEILARLREATADVGTPLGARGEVPMIATPATSVAHTLELFAENVADYQASVTRCRPDDVGQRVAAALTRAGARSVLVPDELQVAWVEAAHAAGVELRADTDGTGPAELDGIDAVVTAARAGIATTGTIILDHAGDQGRRALTLVPDQHICVIRSDQVVHDVPDALPRLDPALPLTWISGPSATSDIELDRVEGVHGPRTLDVILVDIRADLH